MLPAWAWAGPYMAHRDMRVISQLRKEKEKEKERYKCLQLDF